MLTGRVFLYLFSFFPPTFFSTFENFLCIFHNGKLASEICSKKQFIFVYLLLQHTYVHTYNKVIHRHNRSIEANDSRSIKQSMLHVKDKRMKVCSILSCEVIKHNGLQV